MSYTRLSVFLLSFLSLPLIGCAGPTTPFGSLNAWTTYQLESLKLSFSSEFSDLNGPAILVTPDRQVLHGKSTPKIAIFDPDGIPKDAIFKAYFGGHDVSDKVFKDVTEDLHPKARHLKVEFKNLRIPPGWEKEIVFTYKRTKTAKPVVNNWKTPECLMTATAKIGEMQNYNPPRDWIDWIEAAAKESKINPAMVAGLVAQESSFNPKAVSWAKAIGLTQITPVADREIATIESDWPRSTQIESYPAPLVRTLIASDKITHLDDYRLDPELSLKAGAHYLEYLRDYWGRTEHQVLLAETFGQDPAIQSKVILASYNSGAYRVKTALQSKGENFLAADDLKEARKYVSRVSSFCYHFADKGKSQ